MKRETAASLIILILLASVGSALQEQFSKQVLPSVLDFVQAQSISWVWQGIVVSGLDYQAQTGYGPPTGWYFSLQVTNVVSGSPPSNNPVNILYLSARDSPPPISVGVQLEAGGSYTPYACGPACDAMLASIDPSQGQYVKPEQQPTTATVNVYSLPIDYLGQDPASLVGSDLHATITKNYVLNGQRQSYTGPTPFSFQADVGSQATFSVASPPAGWDFQCMWDNYGYGQQNSCTMNVQIVSGQQKIVAFFKQTQTQTLVKVIATVTTAEKSGGGVFVTARIEEVLEDPTNAFKIGDATAIDAWCDSTQPACRIDWPLTPGDRIEVYGEPGLCKAPWNNCPPSGFATGIWIGAVPQHLTKISQRVKFQGVVVHDWYSTAASPGRVIDVDVRTVLVPGPSWLTPGQVVGAADVRATVFCPAPGAGRVDDVHVGDRVEVYGSPPNPNLWYGVQVACDPEYIIKTTTTPYLTVECVDLNGHLLSSKTFSYRPGDQVNIDPSICASSSAPPFQPAASLSSTAGIPLQFGEEIVAAVLIVGAAETILTVGRTISFTMPEVGPAVLGLLKSTSEEVTSSLTTIRQAVSDYFTKNDVKQKIEDMIADAKKSEPYKFELTLPGSKIITAITTLGELQKCLEKQTDDEKIQCVESLDWLAPAVMDSATSAVLDSFALAYSIRYPGVVPPFKVADLANWAVGLVQAIIQVLDWINQVVNLIYNLMQQFLCEIIRVITGGNGSCFVANSPVALLAVDPQGRRVGTVLENGEWRSYNEIPDARYSGPNSHPQYIYTPSPPNGYQLIVSARQPGSYTVQAVDLSSGTTVFQETNTMGGSEVQSHRIIPSRQGCQWCENFSLFFAKYSVEAILLLALALIPLLLIVRRKSRPKIREVQEGPRVIS